MKTITAKRFFSDEEIERKKGKFLDENSYEQVIEQDCDAFDSAGKLLFKFRKNIIPHEIHKSGYLAFKDSIQLTDGRGISSGSSHKRINKDGTVSKITIGNKVYSGNVGFMDSNAMVRYCRKTAFARDYFEKFKQGIPFVSYVDKLYEQLCPEYYAIQKRIATGTDINYLIGDTSFTTVTVNRNFQTAVHKDSGDLPQGFGNLCVYREGNFGGGYFTLPEYKIAIDMRTSDVLFVDVHKWHGNTPFVNFTEDCLRIAFVMYYREYMYMCKSPKQELFRTKMEETGYMTL